MATIKFSPIVSDVRGLIGGTVFARNANGSYIRTYRMPVNKNTEVLQVKRNNLAFYSAEWRQLTDAERNSWIKSASQFPYKNRVGETSFYTGYQLYMKTNLVLETAALDS